MSNEKENSFVIFFERFHSALLFFPSEKKKNTIPIPSPCLCCNFHHSQYLEYHMLGINSTNIYYIPGTVLCGKEIKQIKYVQLPLPVM